MFGIALIVLADSAWARLLAAIPYGDPADRWRILSIKANTQPAYAWYQREPATGRYRAFAIQVLTLRGRQISDVTTFGFPQLFPSFCLALEIEA